MRLIVMNVRKRFLSVVLASTLTGAALLSTVAPADAQNRYYRDYRDRYQNSGSYWNNHPYVQKALIGGGIGAVIGGVLTRDTDWTSGAVKGGLLGGAAGAGYEYLKRQRF